MHETMSFERGYNMFGERSIDVTFKKYKQMEKMEVMIGFNPESLTAEKKQKALREVNIIKMKRSGKVKDRMCANGAPHCKFLPREEVKSPKITLEVLLTTMLIDAYEESKVSTLDVPGANVLIDLTKEKFTLLLLEGKMCVYYM